MFYKDKCQWKPHLFLLYRIWNISNKTQNSLRGRFNADIGHLHWEFIMAFRSPDSHTLTLKMLAQLPPVSEGTTHSIEIENHNFHVMWGPIIPERSVSASCFWQDEAAGGIWSELRNQAAVCLNRPTIPWGLFRDYFFFLPGNLIKTDLKRF